MHRIDDSDFGCDKLWRNRSADLVVARLVFDLGGLID